MIISAFAASGKTKLAEVSALKVIDLESSDFQWTFLDEGLSVEERKGVNEKIKNPNFIDHYVSAILKADKENDLVLIAAQPEVLDELTKRGAFYKLVTPTIDMKPMFMKRYTNRGNNEGFIKLMDNNFENFINSMIKRSQEEDNADLLFLSKSKPYLSDLF